jgi:hypothetical protein
MVPFILTLPKFPVHLSGTEILWKVKVYPLNKRLGWHQNRSDRFVEEGESSLPCWETKQDTLVIQPVS